MRDAFGHTLAVTPPRPLTLPELRALHRQGFTLTAKALASTVCEDCGHATGTRFHRECCVNVYRPEVAAVSPVQPWVPRPSRRRAA